MNIGIWTKASPDGRVVDVGPLFYNTNGTFGIGKKLDSNGNFRNPYVRNHIKDLNKAKQLKEPVKGFVEKINKKD